MLLTDTGQIIESLTGYILWNGTSQCGCQSSGQEVLARILSPLQQIVMDKFRTLAIICVWPQTIRSGAAVVPFGGLHFE